MAQDTQAKRRITVRLNAVDWDFFNRVMKSIALRRDAFLNRVLREELELFAKAPGNDDAGARHRRDVEKILAKYTKQVSLNLDVDLVERLEQVCKDKRVTRDAFLGVAIKFLSSRLAVPALVIQSPRKTAGLGERAVINKLPEYYMTNEERDDLARKTLYEDQLITTAERVAAGKKLLEEFARDIEAIKAGKK